MTQNADELAFVDFQRQSGDNRDAVIARVQIGDFQQIHLTPWRPT